MDVRVGQWIKLSTKKIDAFQLWYWRRLFKSPLDCKKVQSVHPKEISPGCSLEGLMLKLNLQYFGQLMQRADSFEKTLMLGKIEGGRRRGWHRMRWLDGITDSMDMIFSKLQQGGLVCYSPWDCKESDKTEWLNWIELNWKGCESQL